MSKAVPAGGLRLDYLYEFGVFSQYLNVSKASAELNMSPSALSKHLAEIEDSLGLALIDRGQKMSLTPAGHVMADCFMTLLGQYRDAYQRGVALQSEKHSILRLEETPTTSASAQAYDFIREFILKSNRPVRLQLSPLQGETAEEAICNGSLDMALVFHFGEVDDLNKRADENDIGLIYLGDEALNVWGRVDNALIAEREAITFNELKGMRIMTPSYKAFRDAMTGMYETLYEHHKANLLFDSRSTENFLEFVMLDPQDSVYLLPDSTFEDPLIKYRTGMTRCRIDDDDFFERKFLAYSLARENSVVEDIVDFFQQHWRVNDGVPMMI